ncbi:MAG: hypothetical protein AUK03_08045 [Anaerolineae bacterium CG2_30_64_16]|nr:MAG: hypothetical protein AUK03_08045 [Anaerolineae bacterium CG2_30_64_16]
MGNILRARGFAVTQITDPHAVLERVRADGQGVLLNMKLNHISGLEVLQSIRARYPHLPVIVVTGYRAEMAAVLEAALKIGAYTCFYKPLQIEELLRVLTRIQHQTLGEMLGWLARKEQKWSELSIQDPVSSS